ncbi:flagellin hook IN motif-containing protein [Fredinandcohnia sp. 179-A 10B2 NHS]|uniref:flagellin hook IN motif-containing protein n=1 Tax=Fredinandcohnia sp. 179-A 10B2 NHS TaxID=3235176 RepID=UPI00399FF1BF
MKKLFAFLSIIFVLYIIYYDIKIGTLPSVKGETIEVLEKVLEDQPVEPSIEIKVKAGDTVLSIVEEINKNTKITSIEKVIKDFEELNQNTKADLLQIGKTYQFPLYTND